MWLLSSVDVMKFWVNFVLLIVECGIYENGMWCEMFGWILSEVELNLVFVVVDY